MKMLYKLLSLSLSIIVTVLFFTSCGKKTTVITSEGWEDESEFISVEETSSDESDVFDQSSTVSDNSVKPSSSKSQKEEDDVVQNADGSFNLKGATVTIAAWGAEGLKPQASSPTYKEEAKLVSQIEKKYNCKINFKASADSLLLHSAFVTASMAGTKYCDIFYGAGDSSFPTIALNGWARCLDDYFDFSEVRWLPVVDSTLKLNGKHYYLATVNMLDGFGCGVFFNEKLFKQFGEKTPHQYMDENKWTWDTFKTVARKMTRKDGTTQYYGVAGIWMKPWFTSNGADYFLINKDGTHSFNFGDKKCIEAVQFVYDLYNVDKVMPVENGDNLFNSGYVAMDVMDWYVHRNSDFKYAEMPIGYSANDYVHNKITTGLFLIPSTVKSSNVAAVASILDDYTSVQKWRLSGNDRAETYFEDERSVEIARNINQKVVQSKDWISFYEYTYRQVFWGDFGIRSQVSPQAYVKSIEAACTNEINAVWARLKNLK